MNDKLYQLALFGHPVAHSLSPKIHQQFAKQFGITIDYQLIDVKSDGFLQAVTTFFHSGGHGANVTLPHKQEARTITSQISKLAKVSGAVNTLYQNESFEICGDNTDGIGFIMDLKNRCHFNCQNKKIVILGAGGAAMGIIPPILMQSPAEIYVVNRTLAKAQTITRFKNTHALSIEQFDSFEHRFDLIVHASSLGHKGKTMQFDNKHCHAQTLCYDLSYGHAALAFIKLAKKMGLIRVFDGKGMLIEQAAGAFYKWFGKKANTSVIHLPSIVR